mgnify:FL=1
MSKTVLVTARLKNRDETTKLTSIHIHNDILSWMNSDDGVSGNKQVAFNYIISEGIKSIRKKDAQVVVEELHDLV